MSTNRRTKSNKHPKYYTNDDRTELYSYEWEFINNYIQTGDSFWALKNTRFAETNTDATVRAKAKTLLESPRIIREINKIMQEQHENSVMSAQEVMEYFTSVVRGEIKDQFGLDAPLSERTRAAQELAKRTIDVENKQKLMETEIPTISIKLVRE